jgi:alpha-tubulin suppressor-like RCC1 family protein
LRNLKNVISICCGSLHNLALTFDGNLYSWGCGEGGQLGHSEKLLVSSEKPGCLMIPTIIERLRDVKISKISCGEV